MRESNFSHERGFAVSAMKLGRLSALENEGLDFGKF